MTSTVQMPRISKPSADQFREIADRGLPVILENTLSDWSAIDKWSPEYLRRELGSLPVTFKQSRSHIHPDFGSYYVPQGPVKLRDLLAKLLRRNPLGELTKRNTLPLDRYLDLVLGAPDGANYYLSGDELLIFNEGNWSSELDKLRGDFVCPSFIPEDKLEAAGVWVSVKGVRSHLHYDGNGCHNLNAQVTGEKHVMLYSPDQMDAMYPHYISKMDPFNFSQVNVEAVDPQKFPKFTSASGHEGTLRAGDLLFIPAYWFHTFRHLGDFNSNVNFWWHPEFIRQSPVSVRAALGRATFDVAVQHGKIPPLGLIKWAGRLEDRVIQGK